MNNRNWLGYAFLISIIVILICAIACNKEKKATIIYKKGLPHIVGTRTGKTDTVKIAVPVHHYHKAKIKIVHDTVTKHATIQQEIKYNGLSIILRDTLQKDSVIRSITVTGTDTTRFITRVDTVDRLQVDTLFITKEKKMKGLAILCAGCFTAGYAAGSATR